MARFRITFLDRDGRSFDEWETAARDEWEAALNGWCQAPLEAVDLSCREIPAAMEPRLLQAAE